MNAAAISATVIALIAIVFAYGLFSWVGRSDEDADGVKELAGFVGEGITAFLKRECKVMIPTILVLFVILGLLIDWTTAVIFVIGALFSAFASFFGMKAAAKGSMRTANCDRNGGMDRPLKIAIRSGAVMGLCVAGLGLLGIGGVFVILGIQSAKVIAGFGFGASAAALFGRGTGGIYTNAAQAAGGRGIDLFESYAGSVIAAIIVAATAKSINPVFGYPFDLPAVSGAVFPLLLSAAGILGSMAGVMFIKGNQKDDPTFAINAGKYFGVVVVVIYSLISSWVFFGNFNCAVCILIGMLIGVVFGRMTGMRSVLWSMIALAAGILAAVAFAESYGITLAASGMLSTVGMNAAIDAYGTVSGNASEIARMASLSDEARRIVDKLASAGKSNIAKGKGFVIGAAALTAIALFISYGTVAEQKTVNLMKPTVIAALLIGAMLPVLLAAVTMNSTGKTDAGTKTALKRAAALALLAILVPLAVGFFMGTGALGGLLVGSLASGTLTAIILANTGGDWNYADQGDPGEPSKDAAVADILGFMRLIAITAVVFAPLFL